MTRSEIEDRIAVLLGGRVAEELVYGEVSTGAHNDLERATELARLMVMKYGMSERLGLATYGERRAALPQGRRRGGERDYSDATARAIDEEVRDDPGPHAGPRARPAHGQEGRAHRRGDRAEAGRDPGGRAAPARCWPEIEGNAEETRMMQLEAQDVLAGARRRALVVGIAVGGLAVTRGPWRPAPLLAPAASRRCRLRSCRCRCR